MENYQLGLEHVRGLRPNEGLSKTEKKWFLWNIIDVDPEHCIEEAGVMLRTGGGLSYAPAQVLKMYKHVRVRDFLTSATSDAIFVEAPLPGEEMSRCSAMSLACAMLLQDISDNSHAAAIHYFCGPHSGIQDPVSGGIGIVRILLGQLLCLQEFDFTFLDEDWSAALDQRNPRRLLQLFEPLVAQLKVPTLFCIIDAINLFEGNKRKNETATVISELLRVALHCRHFVNLKLLVTSASRRRFIAPIFQQEGLKRLVRLQPSDGDVEVSMRAVKLEIARNGIGLFPDSPESVFWQNGIRSEEAH